MTQRIDAEGLRAILRDPAARFRRPQDVLDAPGLTHDQRLEILKRWEYDARSLAVAEEEGMAGGEESLLRRVRRAIAALGGDGEAEPIGTATKHG
ncbi:MAG TPA: hypothetical protein VMG55_17305 [Stellaceae bacterium]|nr:hypothetical protein [Stellaceae bacterium]